MPLHPQGHPPSDWREIIIEGSNAPAHAIARGSQIVPAESGRTRSNALIDDVRARFHAGRLDKMFLRLDEALDAEIWVRGRGDDGRMTYIRVPDHASRLTAIRLGLAYKYGNPVSASEIRMLRAPSDEPARLSPEEQLAELRATGLDLESVVKTWLGGIKSVSPAVTGAEKAAENAENTPTAPLADAFLEI